MVKENSEEAEASERELKMKSRSTLLLATLLAAALIMGSGMALARMALAAEEIPQVSFEDLKKMIDGKKTDFLVVDVQPKAVYDISHIAGAVSFPWDDPLKSSGNLPRDKKLIFYCDCPHEEDSTSVATQLKQKFRYADVAVLKGRWSKWQELGYPVEQKK